MGDFESPVSTIPPSRQSGGTVGNRTRDPRIKSPVLYLLSYGPICDTPCLLVCHKPIIRIRFEFTRVNSNLVLDDGSSSWS
jgi:hypothetical protein